MKYVIQGSGSPKIYYMGPQSNYSFKVDVTFNFRLDKATVFDTLEQARDTYKTVRNAYPFDSFSILEYHPATVGNVVPDEKDMLINNLQEIVSRINNGSFNVSWSEIKEIVPTIDSAIKFIKRNVND